MPRRLRGSQIGKPCAKHARAETVVIIVKRNLGDCLRTRTTHRREMEMLFKVLTHNIMIIRRQTESRNRALPTLFLILLLRVLGSLKHYTR